MPLNFMWLGFVVHALPEARIVHTRRDGRAVCWSIFRQYWSSSGNRYAYDLREVARFFRMYEDVMEFWHRMFPGRIHDLEYENLTVHQEAETRKLLDFVGVGWEANCLRFHEGGRPVRTTSSMQVRRKMYTGSSEAWRNYDAYLAPMLEVLEDR